MWFHVYASERLELQRSGEVGRIYAITVQPFLTRT